MAKEIDKQISLDSHFYVPPGVIDVRPGQVDDDGQGNYDNPQDIAVEGPVAPEPDSPPMPPTSFQIVEQRVRIASDGHAVVDVLIEVPDVAGVDNIDVRVSKV